MILAWKLAVRFLKSGRLQTTLIITGVSIAIAVQVFIGLLMGSLQKGFVDRTLGSSADITIESSIKGAPAIQNWAQIVAMVEEADGVKSVSIAADGNAFAERDTAVYLRGFVLDEIDNTYDVSDSIIEGSVPVNQLEVLIGKELSDNLKIGIGETLTVTVPAGLSTSLLVTGVYDLGVEQINQSWIITSIDSIQTIFGYGESVTSIEIGISDVFKADTIAQIIAMKLENQDVEVSNWKDENEELFQALRSQDISTYMIQTAVIASVVVAIASMLAISVLQKSRQIGILKAMGIKDVAASLVFLFQGFMLGLTGSIIGIGIGIGMLYSFTSFVTADDGSSLIEFYLDWQFILLSWAIAIIASTLAGILPARRSARLNPIEVINAG